MRVTRVKKLTVNMGQYESFQFGAEVTMEHADLGLTDEDLANFTVEQLANTHESLINKATELLAYTIKDEVTRVQKYAPNTSKAKSLLA